MRTVPPHTAEEATPRELWSASARLLAMLVVLILLVIPLVRDLPVGATTRTSLLAWLLVALALYWLYSGLGYRPLLLTQLFLFSAAAALLTAKVALVLMEIPRFSILRRAAWALLFAGLGCAAANLGGMLFALARRRTKPSPPLSG
ncbi:MAG: hypothetical protein ACT4PM_02895 [Gemmatimonadales bacterium]